MSAKLTFVSAGAGSGKTYRLTTILHTELTSKRVKPSGVIATTFTRKAATELRERVRGFMLEKGEYVLANAMGQAQIGTVNAVCGDILRRFAFEAGLPVEQTVLEEAQATQLLRQAIEMVQANSEAAVLSGLRERMGIEDEDWDRDFKGLVATIRANDIDPTKLVEIAQENAVDLLAHFPAPATADLDKDLLAALNHAIPLIQATGNNTQVTAKYLEIAQTLKRGLEYHDAKWSDWVKISKAAPAAALKPLAASIQAITANVVAHAGLHNDLREYLTHQFRLAAQVLEAYNTIKIERGVIDFTDQERLLLKLLDNPFVAETLGNELDLLMVDEFQDTSPIQLALFIRLANFAKQVYWVGDVKQAIYGFRGSDTELMSAILHELPNMGGTKEALTQSWRSREPLVDLVNAVFVPAFAGSISENEVALAAQRSEVMPDAPFASWILPGNASVQIQTLGQALRHTIESGYSVFDKDENRLRPARLGDIAILRRSNDKVTATAQELVAVGIPAMTAQPGLLKTPEAILAVACLRRLNDVSDTLASAEIISLSDCDEPEIWVSDRLSYLAAGYLSQEWRETGDQAHKILSRLATLRQDLLLMTPAEALATAIADCHLPSIVLGWSQSADRGRVRLANLEALIAMARQYETVCESTKQGASVSGLLLWLSQQAKDESDGLALPAIDAVQVLTHHAAKGLEWPIVVLMDTHGEVKDGLWNTLRAASREPITAADPLRNRTLRFWPWPFGKQKTLPLNDEIAISATGIKFQQLANEEAKRLLYVSMTRARDLLIFANQKSDAPDGSMLKTLDAAWLNSLGANDYITLPNGKQIQSLPLPDIKEASTVNEFTEQLFWYETPKVYQEHLSRTFNPSKADSPPMTVTKEITLGKRIDIGSAVDWATVGHAVHAAIALAFVDTSRPLAIKDVESIVQDYQLNAHVSATALVSQINHLAAWITQEWPGAKALPEWPIESVLKNGQILNGRIDLLIDVGTHWILIDHKSNPGARANWAELANKHGGQLLAYKEAVENATGKPVKEMWIVLPVSGGAMRLEKASA